MLEWINPLRRCDDYVLLEVCPQRLVATFVVSHPGESLVWNEGRFQRMLERLQQGGEMDAPVVDYCRGVQFTDGRHRTAAAAALGIEHMKVLVHQDQAEVLERLLLPA